MIKNKLIFIKICYYVGAVIDLFATVQLVFPEVAKIAYGHNTISTGNDYLFASRVGASLMFGWTLLLLWGSFKPIERRGVLLLTVFPVLFGLVITTILVVNSGYIEVKFIVPLWILYSLIITSYIIAYIYAGKMESKS